MTSALISQGIKKQKQNKKKNVGIEIGHMKDVPWPRIQEFYRALNSKGT